MRRRDLSWLAEAVTMYSREGALGKPQNLGLTTPFLFNFLGKGESYMPVKLPLEADLPDRYGKPRGLRAAEHVP